MDQDKLIFNVRPDESNRECHQIVYRYGFLEFSTQNLIELQQELLDYIILNNLQKSK